MDKEIVVVEDEKDIGNLIELYLSNEGFNVTLFESGVEALKYIEANTVDLAILDIMLPDITGFEITKKIREKYFFPIIILSARVEDIDKINGLTLGADDYIVKPFNPLEVVARVKTQLRRVSKYNESKQVGKSLIDIRGLIINNATHQVSLYDKNIELTPTEFAILHYLGLKQGNVVSSEELFEVVWKEKYYNNNNTVMAHIARVREKLNDSSKKPKFIVTVWGVGYKIE